MFESACSTKMEASIDLLCQHSSVTHSLFFVIQLKREDTEQQCSKYFHLPVSKLFSKTNSWACLHTYISYMFTIFKFNGLECNCTYAFLKRINLVKMEKEMKFNTGYATIVDTTFFFFSRIHVSIICD